MPPKSHDDPQQITLSIVQRTSSSNDNIEMVFNANADADLRRLNEEIRREKERIQRLEEENRRRELRLAREREENRRKELRLAREKEEKARRQKDRRM